MDPEVRGRAVRGKSLSGFTTSPKLFLPFALGGKGGVGAPGVRIVYTPPLQLSSFDFT